MTRQDFVDQYRKDVEWVNGQIRICRLARRLLKGFKQNDYWWLIRHASEHVRPELLPLKALIDSEPYRDAYQLRFSNYGAAILHVVFDIRKWIYEARVLKWRAQESPWLVAGANA